MWLSEKRRDDESYIQATLRYYSSNTQEVKGAVQTNPSPLSSLPPSLQLAEATGKAEQALQCFHPHHKAKNWRGLGVQLSCVWLCDPMHCSMLGFPVLHYLLKFAQTHVHWVSDAMQSSHPLSSPSPALNISQYWGLFQWVGSLHHVAGVSELQLQHQSLQWIFSIDFL